jgi:hypothetical protein
MTNSVLLDGSFHEFASGPRRNPCILHFPLSIAVPVPVPVTLFPASSIALQRIISRVGERYSRLLLYPLSENIAHNKVVSAWLSGLAGQIFGSLKSTSHVAHRKESKR